MYNPCKHLSLILKGLNPFKVTGIEQRELGHPSSTDSYANRNLVLLGIDMFSQLQVYHSHPTLQLHVWQKISLFEELFDVLDGNTRRDI